MEIIASITAAIATVKQVLELKGMAKNAEAKLLLAELQVKLAEVHSRLAVVMMENQQLRDQLAKATSPPEVVFKDGAYYLAKNNDGPFCTVCYDRGRDLIRLTELAAMFHDEGRFHCGSCGGRFQPRRRTGAPVTVSRPRLN